MDWWLNGAVFFLALMSLLTIYSLAPHLFWYQLIWFGLGFLLIWGLSLIDWRPLINYRLIVFGIYLAALLLLLITYLFAPEIRGTRSWLSIGSIQIQTAEIAKLALIILFSYYFAHRHVGIAHWRNILVPFFYLAIPLGFILAQPDLGSALVLTGLWGGYLLVSGIRWRHLLVGLLIGVILLSVGWNNFLKDYQRERIIGLLNPNYDPLGINYSAIQARIAIGSAGFWGKGFQQGTQTQLGFLPEAATDFIFAGFTEEWGLLGALVLLGIFIFMMVRITQIGLRATNNFGKLICLGSVILFLIHFVINIGSNIGLMPVIGISLPFFSYGGSNLLLSASLIGMVQSILIHNVF